MKVNKGTDFSDSKIQIKKKIKKIKSPHKSKNKTPLLNRGFTRGEPSPGAAAFQKKTLQVPPLKKRSKRKIVRLAVLEDTKGY